MAGQAPIDPLTAMQALLAAWNRSQENSAPPAPSPAVIQAAESLGEIVGRLGRIEETLLRIEALAARRDARDAAREERRRAKHQR